MSNYIIKNSLRSESCGTHMRQKSIQKLRQQRQEWLLTVIMDQASKFHIMESSIRPSLPLKCPSWCSVASFQMVYVVVTIFVYWNDPWKMRRAFCLWALAFFSQMCFSSCALNHISWSQSKGFLLWTGSTPNSTCSTLQKAANMGGLLPTVWGTTQKLGPLTFTGGQ